jgi:ribonuclease D
VVRVHVIASQSEFLDACNLIESGSGPISIDAERASGFTYSQRAYLIQVYRREAGTFLFDPPAIGSMAHLMNVVGDEEFVLHAASQDLRCLREVGIDPRRIFDTELSARLLGLERVGLGAVVENLLGIHLAKEHSAVNWSTRPLPDSWLAYAAADVEHLIDLREKLAEMLAASGKDKFADAEFEATRLKPEKTPSPYPWRKLSGLHTLRNARQLAIARELWLARDHVAKSRDISPGRLIPDSAILAAVNSGATNPSDLLSAKGFNGRDAKGSLKVWWAAYEKGLQTDDLPVLRIPSDTLPSPRIWRDKNPEGYARLTVARHAIAQRAIELTMPVENLLSPAALRQLAWSPPEPLTPETVSATLLKESARAWQIKETAHLISDAFTDSEAKMSALLAIENESNSQTT